MNYSLLENYSYFDKEKEHFQDKHTLSIGAMFKDESLCLEEWINHYIARGVDHFYLINDNSSDDYMSIIKKYNNITLFHNEIKTKEIGRQIRVYNEYLKPILHETKWLAIIDLDEFLYSPLEKPFKTILQEHESYSSIRVDWLSFGSNEHIFQPLSLVSGFTKRAEFDPTSEMIYSYKTLFQTDKLKHQIGIHSTDVVGESIHLKYHDTVPLVINHYQIQSESFWKNKKLKRGDADNWANRTLEEFHKRDAITNAISDLRLFHQNVKAGVIPTVNDEKDDVTLVITSCNRPDKLRQTLESFVLMNTYPIKKTFIIEDSGVIGCNDEIIKSFSALQIEMIYNKSNKGQVPSIDKVYSYIRTKWIFHCEEDWTFLKPYFIEKSMNVFHENQSEKIFTVWLRPHHDTSLHPIIKDNLNRGYYKMHPNFSYEDQGKTYTWCGVTLNPGLRKTSDCLLLHPYEYQCETSIDKKGRVYVGEYTINKKYKELGYFAYILDDPNGHVTHNGWDAHIVRPWE